MKFSRDELLSLATLSVASVLPFVSFADVDKGRSFDDLRLIGYCVGFVALTWLIALALRAAFARPYAPRIINSLAIVVYCLFLYDMERSAVVAVIPRGGSIVALPVWIALTVLAVWVCWRWARVKRAGTVVLVVAVAMLAVPTLRLAIFYARTALASEVALDTARYGKPFKRRPDIYFFLLDGYARQDKIKNLLGYDNSAFIDFLHSQGFTVAGRGTANYPTTWLSVASTASMKYIQTESMPPYLSSARFYEIMRGDNAVVKTLRSQGYGYIYVANGNPAFNCPGIEDACIGRQSRSDAPLLGEMEINLLNATPILPALMKISPDVVVRPFQGSMAQISDVAGDIARVPLAKPFYLYAHLIVPHPPFLRDADCKPTNSRDVNLRGWSRSGMRAYTDYMQCANSQMMALLQRIIARDSDAIIIIQGDHGTAFFMNWKLPLKNWPKSGNAERLAPLNAIRLPQTCRKTLYSTMSLVNTFRAVFGCLEDQPPDYLPDISYISPDSDNAEFGHVLRVDPNGQ